MKNTLSNPLRSADQIGKTTTQNVFDIKFSVSKVRERAIFIACDSKQLAYALFLANRIVSTSDSVDFDVVLCSTVEESTIDENLLNGIRYGQIFADFSDMLAVDERIPIAGYYRLWIPYKISEYHKVVYLDTDTIPLGTALQSC